MKLPTTIDTAGRRRDPHGRVESAHYPPLTKAAYTGTETCELLSFSKRSLARAIKRGLIKRSLAFRTIIVPASEIRRFLEETL